MTVTTESRKRIDNSWDESLAANQKVVHSLGTVPSGKQWRVLRFGGAATGAGGDSSAKVTLEVGGKVCRAMGLVATALQLEVDTDIESGAEVVVRIGNGPGSPKDVVVWITGYEF